MITVDGLKKMGANTKEGLARCLNNEEMYLRLVQIGIHDQKFESLESSIERGDVRGAFEAAHAIKGVCASLSLDMLTEPVSALTELLRGTEAISDPAEAKRLCGEIRTRLDAVLELESRP